MVNRYLELLDEVPKGSFYDAVGHVLPARDTAYDFVFTTSSVNTVFGVFVDTEFRGTVTTDALGEAVVSAVLATGQHEIVLENDDTGARTPTSHVTVLNWATWMAAYAEALEGTPSFVGIDPAIDSVLAATRLADADARHIEDVHGKILRQTNDLNYILDTYRGVLQDLRQSHRIWGARPAGMKQTVHAYTSVSPFIVPNKWRPRWVLGDDLGSNSELQLYAGAFDPITSETPDILQDNLNLRSIDAVHLAFGDDLAAAPGPITQPPVAQVLTVSFSAGWVGGNVIVTGTAPGGGARSEQFVAAAGSRVLGAEVFETVTSITNTAPAGPAGTASVGLGVSRFITVNSIPGPPQSTGSIRLTLEQVGGVDVLVLGSTTTGAPADPVEIPVSGTYVLDALRDPQDFYGLVVEPGGGFDLSDGSGNPLADRLTINLGDIHDISIPLTVNGVSPITGRTVADIVSDLDNGISGNQRYFLSGGSGAVGLSLAGTGPLTDTVLGLTGGNFPKDDGTIQLKILPGCADAALTVLGIPRHRSTLDGAASVLDTSVGYITAGNGLPTEGPTEVRVGRGLQASNVNEGALSSSSGSTTSFTQTLLDIVDLADVVRASFAATDAQPITAGITNPPSAEPIVVVMDAAWTGGTVTVVGTNAEGQSITEDFLDDASDVARFSTQAYATVTSITWTNGAGAGNATIGLARMRDFPGGCVRIVGATNILNNGLHPITGVTGLRRVTLQHEDFDYNSIVVSGPFDYATGPDTITLPGGGFRAFGYKPGRQIEVTNSDFNDGVYTVSTMTDTVLTISAGGPLTAETVGTSTLTGVPGAFVDEGAGTLDWQLWTPGELVDVIDNDTATTTLTLAAPGLRHARASGALVELADEMPVLKTSDRLGGPVTVTVDRTLRPTAAVPVTDLVTEVGGSVPDGWLVRNAASIDTLYHAEFDRTRLQLTRALASGVSLTYADANPDTITRGAGSFLTDGFSPGGQITVSGTVSNDGVYTIATVTALVITLVSTDTLVAEGPVASTISGSMDLECDASTRVIPTYRGYPLRISFWVQQHNVTSTQDFVIEASTDGTTFSTVVTTAVAGTVVNTTTGAGTLDPSVVTGIFVPPHDAGELTFRLRHVGTAAAEVITIERAVVAAEHSTALFMGGNTIVRTPQREHFGELLYVWSPDTLTSIENTALGMPVAGGTSLSEPDNQDGHIDLISNAHGSWERFNVTTTDNLSVATDATDWVNATLTNMEIVLGSPDRLTYVRPSRVSRVVGEVLTVAGTGVATLTQPTTHDGPYPQDPNNTVRLFKDGVPVPDTADASGTQPYVFTAADTIDIDPTFTDTSSTYTIDYDVLIRAESPVLDLGTAFNDHTWLADAAMFRRTELDLGARAVSQGIVFLADFTAGLSLPSDQDKTTGILTRDNGIARETVPDSAWSYNGSTQIAINASDFVADSLYTLEYVSVTSDFNRIAMTTLATRNAATSAAVLSATYVNVELDAPLNRANRFHQFRLTLTDVSDTRDVRLKSLGARGIRLFGTTPVAPGIIV